MCFRLLITLLLLPIAGYSQMKTVVQQGHAEAVTAVKYSKKGDYILSGSRDKSIKIWERSSGNEIASFRDHKSTVKDITISEDGRYVASVSADGWLILWDLETHRVIYDQKVSDQRLNSVELDSDNIIFVGGYENLVWKIDPSGVGKIDSIKTNSSQVLGTQLLLDRKEKLLYTGEDNRTTRIYDLEAKVFTDTLDSDWGTCGGCSTVSDIGFGFIARLSNSDTLYIYDYKTKNTLYKPGIEEDDPIGVKLLDRERVLIATEKSMKVLEIETGVLLQKVEIEDEFLLNSIDFHKNEFITGHNDNIVRIWDLQTMQPIDSLSGILNQRDREGLEIDPNSYWDYQIAQYVKRKNRLLLHPDHQKLIKGKPGIMAKSWNIKNGTIEMEYRGHDYAVTAVAISPDGTTLITGDAEGYLKIWDANTGELKKEIRAHRAIVFDIDFSGNLFLSSGWDGRIVIRDYQTLEILSEKYLEQNSIYTAQFTPDGYYIAVSTLGKELELWEINTLVSVRTFRGHKDVVSSIDFNKEGDQMLTTSWDGYVRVWDINTGMIKYKSPDHPGGAYTAIFSEDEEMVISGGADRKIKFWSLEQKELIKEVEGHDDVITEILQVPEEGILISHSLDGVTRTWNESSGFLFHEHIYTGPGDWMIKTDEGYFKATDGIMDQIHFVKGMNTFDLEQFFEEFYRPDIISNMDFSVPEGSLRRIDERVNDSPPPKTYIRALLNEKSNTASLYLRTINTGGGTKNPVLFQNGKKIADITKEQRSASRGDTTDFRLELPLVLGENRFSFYAYSRNDLASKEAVSTLYSTYETKEPEVHLLAIGINSYASANLNLNYAKDDALSFSDSIYSGSRELFKQVNIRTILDTEATRERILSALDELVQTVQSEDVFIFYYAGHGSMIDNKFYFVPTESRRLYDDKMEQTAIPAELVQSKLREIKALKQMIVMDACQSGASVDVLAKRGLEEERALAQLARSAGIHVLASAGSEQFASEFEELGHGLFTYVLLESLSGKADGAPKDGKITVYEIKSYLDDQVPRYNLKYKGTPQYPYTFSKGNDFPLVVIDQEN